MSNDIAALVRGLRAKAETHRRLFKIETNETQILLTSAADTITTLQADLAAAEDDAKEMRDRLASAGVAQMQIADQLARAEATIEAARKNWLVVGETARILAAYPTSTALNEIRAQAVWDAAQFAPEDLGGAAQWAWLRARAAEIRNTKEAGQ